MYAASRITTSLRHDHRGAACADSNAPSTVIGQIRHAAPTETAAACAPHTSLHSRALTLTLNTGTEAGQRVTAT
ncbi:hypothetical protein EVAR_94803_1 [Eumeta japonica]|uniref:Uncharacterized protein n=1 Tax=Eumeta variegata TaxID=151549 RepID=A0A4C1UIS7_EUMVA|nr:hypothetical protein EVAR_94803_1 [Eumeta japonica]